MKPFLYNQPNKIELPILISSPHSGTQFPEEDKPLYHDSVTENPQDTDWYIDQIYDFAGSLGIPIIAAQYSRYVLDLNRPLKQKPLYNDGRVEHGLFPIQSFSGNNLYLDPDPQTKHEAVFKKRVENIYQPYYEKISSTLNEIRTKFGRCLLFDAHSIKSFVPSIQKERFPSFIIGTADGKSCPEEIAKTAIEALRNAKLGDVQFNTPFKGGHITRHFGKAESNTFSMQLEMTQDLYLNEENNEADREKIETLTKNLKIMMSAIGEKILD